MRAAQLFVVVLAGVLCYASIGESLAFTRSGEPVHAVLAVISFALLVGWVWVAGFRKPRWYKHSEKGRWGR